MKLAETPEEQRQWMAQWREAAVMLEHQRHRELYRMTDAEAQRNSRAVLSTPKPWRRPGTVSGLVEQQAWFKRWPRS